MHLSPSGLNQQKKSRENVEKVTKNNDKNKENSLQNVHKNYKITDQICKIGKNIYV